ncbi:hypothetical protein GCWU000325_00382 [Alloprevotella tannerae ATCC 51259]|uniref:Uncharacterized protein n=1 Tax=Alloprevotella tannerae ATCC 51259 TaxID=626522 RepID=C9LDV9_9BACT|nr:hypothetical protein GCWU000325_00382 [Alloprevotella tannerae ATCC 51259]
MADLSYCSRKCLFKFWKITPYFFAIKFLSRYIVGDVMQIFFSD